MKVLQPRKHRLLVEPNAADTIGSLGILWKPDDWIEVHVTSGWVLAVGELREEIEVGDFVIFLGWKAAILPGYGPTMGRAAGGRLLILHEDDIEAVLPPFKREPDGNRNYGSWEERPASALSVPGREVRAGHLD